MRSPEDRFVVYEGWTERSPCSLGGVARGWEIRSNLPRRQAWAIVQKATGPVEVYRLPLAAGVGPVWTQGGSLEEAAQAIRDEDRAKVGTL
jgi:hypothetical protein